MSVAKVIEIIASSRKGFDEAVKNGIERANSTIDEVMGAWVKDQKVVVEKGKIVEYRVILHVTFMLKDGKRK